MQSLEVSGAVRLIYKSLDVKGLISSAQVSLGLPRFLLPGGLHFITSFGSLLSSIP